MAIAPSPQLADKSSLTDAQASRVLALKRAYQRELGHKPTLIQKTLIDRAAVLTARAQAAALDPSATINDVVRLDGAASRARAAMQAALAPKRKPEPTLEQYLASKHHVSAA
jgi:hypothetical protein